MRTPAPRLGSHSGGASPDGVGVSMRCRGPGIIRTIDGQPRLWEAPHVDAGPDGVDLIGDPGDARAADVGITADARGFTVLNASGADLTVLVTMIARADGHDADEAGARLAALTSTRFREGPLRVAPDGAAAYRRLWHATVVIRESAGRRWVATRAGGLVIALRAGSPFVLAHGAVRLPPGVVVAGVAAIGVGLDPGARLIPVARGRYASLGEQPLFA